MIGESGSVLSGVTKRFSRRGAWVLDGVDLVVEAGVRVVVVGGNGSGKSTLLRIAAGVTRPTAGSVAGSTTVGYVPERLAARIRLTGTEYLAHMGRIKGLDPESIDIRSRELVDRLDLQSGPSVLIDALSKGNRQKLVLAQAFLGPVGLLVLDEPFSGLDAPAHRALSALLDEAQARGASVLMSSHRSDMADGADRLLRIGGGHIEDLGPPWPSAPRWPEPDQQIELVATDDACPPNRIADLAGVRTIRYDAAGPSLSAVVERPSADAFLSAAIAGGWSVVSVVGLGRGDTRG